MRICVYYLDEVVRRARRTHRPRMFLRRVAYALLRRGDRYDRYHAENIFRMLRSGLADR